MRILLAYEHIRRLRGTHGEWITSIGRTLALRGNDVHILCDSVADPALYPELTFHSRRTFVRGESHRLTVLRHWAIRQLREIDYDVSISFHTAIPAQIVIPIAGWIQTRLAREFREHRNPLWSLALHLYPPIIERKYIESTLRKDTKRVRMIGATSRVMKDALVDGYPKLENRVRVVAGASSIQPPPDLESQQQIRSETRQALQLAGDDVVFLWASKRAGWHGAKYAIEAFSKAASSIPGNRAKLILAAEGQWSLYRRATEFQDPKNIRIIGRTEQPERLLAACDAGINPAIHSHLGRFTWECLAFGKPVIVSSNTAAADRIRSHEFGLAGRIITPYDAVSLQKAIQELTDDERRRSATAAAEELAPAMRFSRFIDRLENTICELRGIPLLHDQLLTDPLDSVVHTSAPTSLASNVSTQFTSISASAVREENVPDDSSEAEACRTGAETGNVEYE